MAPKGKIVFVSGILLIVGFLVAGFFILRAGVFTETSRGNTSDVSGTPVEPEALQFGEITVTATGANYKTVREKPMKGWFKTGQDADIMLSGIDFNNTGGSLLFNHPGNVASDGTHLLLADRNNNRVLVWNALPTGNTPPDLVLGQENFFTNNPGIGTDGMNWPVSVTAAGGKVVVADTSNDRLLVWNSFPVRNGQPADFEIRGILPAGGRDGPRDNSKAKRQIGWPWAVWTNGEKLVVTSTASSSVLIWNSFPVVGDQPADIVLYGNNNFGTPRAIASDGKHLVVGDHNAKPSERGGGNFFWKTFPTSDDQPYDFFVAEPGRMGERSASESQSAGPAPGGGVMWGAMTPDGKLIGVTNMLSIWNAFPENKDDGPDVQIGSVPGREGYDFGGKQSGDGTGIAVANTKLYISLPNGNKIVGFNTLPAASAQKPDLAIGSPDIDTNTLETNFIISNGVPATDGKSLFVSSDFDRKLYVWKNLPDESGAHPDYVYNIGGWDNALYGTTFAQTVQQELYIWKELPLDGRLPDIVFRGTIGDIELQNTRGVAMDEKYFYLSDASADKIYIWEGLPSAEKPPKFTLTTDHPLRLSSDGKYLVVTATLSNQTGHIKIFPIANLADNAQPIVLRFRNFRTNLPESAFAVSGHLFIADTPSSRVLIWRDIEQAIAGNDPDTILGAETLNDISAEIGRNKLFWPSGLAYDGSFLWVGEFKFSERILRFSVQ